MQNTNTTNLSAVIEMGTLAFTDKRGVCYTHQIFSQTISDAMEYVLSQWTDSVAPKWEWVKEWNKAQFNF